MLSKEVCKKLSGYKQQDKRHAIYSEKHFVAQSEVRTLLEKAVCEYCRVEVLVSNYDACDKRQWTLDRIDNDMGHNKGNVVLSCLGCNLKRGDLCSVEKFRFTKQLNVVRQGKIQTFEKSPDRFVAVVKCEG